MIRTCGSICTESHWNLLSETSKTVYFEFRVFCECTSLSSVSSSAGGKPQIKCHKKKTHAGKPCRMPVANPSHLKRHVISQKRIGSFFSCVMSAHDASWELMVHHEYLVMHVLMMHHDFSWSECSWCIMRTPGATWVLMVHHGTHCASWYSWCIMSAHNAPRARH